MIGGNHRRTEKHGLDKRSSERLADSGHDESIGCAKERLDRIAKAHEAHMLAEPELRAARPGRRLDIVRSRG